MSIQKNLLSPKGSSTESLEAEALKDLLRLPKLPNLRLAQGSQQCSDCTHFSYKNGRAWRGDGECSKFNSPVKDDFVCDDYESV
jgi:hypothetical protein